MPSPRILILTAAAALAVPASALAADAATRVDEKPFLVQTSNGAYVDYSLTKTVSRARQTVTIDGVRAKLTILDKATGDVRALVARPSLEQGRRYRVTLRVKRPGASDLVRSERLVLHRGGSSRGS